MIIQLLLEHVCRDWETRVTLMGGRCTICLHINMFTIVPNYKVMGSSPCLYLGFPWFLREGSLPASLYHLSVSPKTQCFLKFLLDLGIRETLLDFSGWTFLILLFRLVPAWVLLGATFESPQCWDRCQLGDVSAGKLPCKHGWWW